MPDAYHLLAAFLTDRFDVAPTEITETTTFTDLDLDSLDLAEIAVLIRREHGVALDGVRAASTLGEAARRLEQALSGTQALGSTVASAGQA